MSKQELATSAFPAFSQGVRALWAPVLLEPIAGSYERFVIGVAVAGEAGSHLEVANALDRLRCLYAEDGRGVVYAVQLAAQQLKQDLARRAEQALTDPRPPISAITIGECRQAEGESLEAIGANWMRILSSLYREKIEIVAHLPEIYGEADDLTVSSGADRLPLLVMDYVIQRREGYVPYFSSDLRGGKRGRRRGRSHEVLIDFSGSRLVANFGTLQASRIGNSVNLVKRRLWDLKVDRDREPSELASRQHELILQTPYPDDPQFTAVQHARLREALKALEEQADQEELRLRALNTVAAIGERILRAEAA